MQVPSQFYRESPLEDRVVITGAEKSSARRGGGIAFLGVNAARASVSRENPNFLQSRMRDNDRSSRYHRCDATLSARVRSLGEMKFAPAGQARAMEINR